MKFSKLYLLVLLAVLWAACGTGRESGQPSAADSASTADTVSVGPADGMAVDPENGRTGESADNDDTSAPTVLFLGNSLSAGSGLDEQDAFPSLIRQRIDSLGWNFRVINAGLSGETSSGGLRRIDWVLRQPVNVLVLELGGNDGLRGIPVDVTRENLRQIIRKTRDVYPDVRIVLAGMQIPPNLGHDYTQRFRAVYPELAEAEDTYLIPFLLEGVGGVDSLMQGDGIHPTEEGHRLVAENVWKVLAPVLQSMRAES
ncbi:MAG: arylesterase [Rhodothermales bacterium]